MMETSQIREEIMLATLSHVMFDDWSNQALYAGTQSAGYDTLTMHTEFPNGIQDVIVSFCTWADQTMLESLQQEDYKLCQGTSQRIGYLLNQRLNCLVSYKEPVRRLMAYFVLPPNNLLALRTLYTTVDTMWYAIGDKSTDFSYYSKRATLASICILSTCYWLTSNPEDTKRFIDKNLTALNTFGKVRRSIPSLRNLIDVTKVFSLPIRLIQKLQRRVVDF